MGMCWFRSLLILLLMESVANAEDWPQWLGPRRDGSTVEKIAAWKGDLRVAWRREVAEGHSSPVVADGKVYLHACPKGKDAEVISCFDAVTGKPLWSREYARGPFQGLFGRGPRATPAVIGGKLYAFGATGIVTCLDAAKGDIQWQVDTQKDFKAPTLKFGVSASPLVVGNKVLIAVGAKGASVVAFDKDKGSVLWKSLDDGASYASPILVGAATDPTALYLTQQGLVALRALDGTRLWDFPFKDKLAESATTPVRIGDNVLISSITLGSALLTLSSKDGKTAVSKDWFNKELTCYFSTPVPVGSAHVYLVTGIPSLNSTSTLCCIEAKSGNVLWKKGGVGKYHACLTRTADSKLLMVEEAGHLVLIEPNPAKYEEVCRSKISGETWAHPAIANGRLYIRDEKELVCVELGQ
jgi:outer membrane protein assembly factor BamB